MHSEVLHAEWCRRLTQLFAHGRDSRASGLVFEVLDMAIFRRIAYFGLFLRRYGFWLPVVEELKVHGSM